MEYRTTLTSRYVHLAACKLLLSVTYKPLLSMSPLSYPEIKKEECDLLLICYSIPRKRLLHNCFSDICRIGAINREIPFERGISE